MGTFTIPVPFPAVIPDTAIDLLPLPPEFVRLTADTLQNAATETDGFNVLVSQLFSHAEEVGGIARGLDEDARAFEDIADGLAVPFELEAETEIATAVENGDPEFQQFQTDLGNIVVPPDPPQPQPPGRGGGGGGGGDRGGGGGGGGGCNPAQTVAVYVDGIFVGYGCLQ